MTVINILEYKWVFKHTSSTEFEEDVPRHIVGQIGQNYSSFSCFFNRITLNPNKEKIPVDIHLAVLIVYNARGR